MSAWIAVDDVSVENGCLQFVPGTHKHGRLEPISLTTEGESVVERFKEQGYSAPEPVVMPMRAGGVTFHHGCTFHYAGPNRTGTPRRAFAIIYIPDYTCFTGGHDAAGAAGRDGGWRPLGTRDSSDHCRAVTVAEDVEMVLNALETRSVR